MTDKRVTRHSRELTKLRRRLELLEGEVQTSAELLEELERRFSIMWNAIRAER